MVNKTMYNMKQPELGHKIQNWRKAQGLTQEELVEKCNLNVRTLQRIEAGEVLPRSYTVKSILEVLKVDFSELNLKEDQKNQLSVLLENRKSFLKWGAIVGIVYLCLSFVEGFMEIGFYDENLSGISGLNYSLVKIGVMLTFVVFYYPIYLMGKALSDDFLKVSSLFLITLILISNINDIAVFYTNYLSVEVLLILRSVMFGIGYILIGTAFALRQKSLGTLTLVTGIFGVVTGLGFVSILLAVPALFTLTVFEILMLVMIFKVMNADGLSEGNKKKDFSTALS
ncbi:helix-turn-helix transcriptional regulator [Marivirga tractuosa]|uniref:helix-turn-helix domain-containing protein n=1 Tax=Marivirga tractuosa TaxID=1006 RepID=UPI0035CF8A9D